MCGVAGLFDRSGSAAPTRAELVAMIGTLAHRGPDGYGYLEDGAIGLAHARLSIIDLEGGSQPLSNEDRTIWVVFNGEIFNYVELRRELLAQGHQFATASDTEVIVHLYEQHGARFVEHLNGQFAIALWDRKQGRLVLARDRVGIRPLFYTEHRGRLAFASEVKALLTLPGLERRLDPDALAQLFTCWSTLEDSSVFAGVRQLPPGHVLSVDARGMRLERYWDWTFPAACDIKPRSVDETAEELRALLVDAVRLQLRADVPVGAYLSGGLDSSSITALIHHYSQTPLRTFSVTFEDEEFDERGYQDELVRHLGTQHSALHCTRADIAAAFPRVILHAETPILRAAPAPLMLLADSVRRSGYRVVLTGEGADEVFAGYDLFKEAKIRRFWARQPHSAVRPRILEKLYPYLKHSPVGARSFAAAFFGQDMAQTASPCFAHLPRMRTTQRILQFLSPQLRERLATVDPIGALTATLPAGMAAWAPLARDQYVEAHTLLSGYLLSAQGDRVAMAASIEARFPFLDHRVVEFASRLPAQHKLLGLREKLVLKKAMHGLLPERLRTRTKQPYRAPDSSSFFAAGTPVDYVAELFSRARIADAGYFDAGAVQKLFNKCRSGRAIGFADNMAFMAVLSTMLVHHQLVAGGGLLQAHPIAAE